MRTHLIYGAGRWSHAHLRVLSELGNCEVFLTKNIFTEYEKYFFKSNYSIVKGFLNQSQLDGDELTKTKLSPDFTHIVTPSHTHLDVLNKILLREKKCGAQSVIMIEKPTVLLNTLHDYKKCINIQKKRKNIHYCDWMAWSVSKEQKPKKILKFCYYVENNVQSREIIREVISHFAALCLNFFDFNCEIKLSNYSLSENSILANLTIDGVQVVIDVKTNTGLKSFWEIQLDDYFKNTNSTPGRELYHVLENFISNKKPRTNWIHNSVLTERFNQMLMFNNTKHFTENLNLSDCEI